MKKVIILASVVLLSATGAANSQPSDGPRRDRDAEISRSEVIERSERRFARLDANNDGRLTPEEARANRARRGGENAGRVFDRLDLDRDGSITRREFEQARSELRERRGERRAERRKNRRDRLARGADGGHAVGTGRMFGEQGFITREQFMERALTRFDRHDRNRDGRVTLDERQQMRGQGRD